MEWNDRVIVVGRLSIYLSICLPVYLSAAQALEQVHYDSSQVE